MCPFAPEHRWAAAYCFAAATYVCAVTCTVRWYGPTASRSSSYETTELRIAAAIFFPLWAAASIARFALVPRSLR